jgi:hypothetical protein
MKWSPRSPDLTPRDFSLWGNAKKKVFLSPLPLDVDGSELRITTAERTLDASVSERAWGELD